MSNHPGVILRERLEDGMDAPRPPGSLNELLYTASETGILEDGISDKDALIIWKIVELAKSLGDNCPQELRM